MEQAAKFIHETKGLLAGCGCKLERTGEDQYQIRRSTSGEVLASGNLATIHNTAAFMAASGKFKPGMVATGQEAYLAGKAMGRRLHAHV